jgi:uncharacterized oxidoreductase
MISIVPAALQDFVQDVFVAAGCSAPEGARIGKYLVNANLAGHDSHGVARVPRYVERLHEGLIRADQTITAVVDTPVLAVLDGNYGFGQTVAPQAVEVGIQKCSAGGLSAVALRNAGHIGRVGEWAEMAAGSGLLSVHFVTASGSVLVAPFGGVERRFSTAPICIGIPRGDDEPLILDFATSQVAEGKVLVASQGGTPLPKDALIGPDGAPSTDPHLLYGEYEPSGRRDYGQGKGAIRAFGDHKGSGLALMAELLGGALTGTGATLPGRPFANGMFSFYVDPKRIDLENFFAGEVARYVDFVKSSRPIQANGEVLVPGEPEQRMRAARSSGVPLPDDTWAAMVGTARSLGVKPPQV